MHGARFMSAGGGLKEENFGVASYQLWGTLAS